MNRLFQYTAFPFISLYSTVGYVLLEGIFPQSHILLPFSEAKAAGT